MRAADLSGADLRWSEFARSDLSFARLVEADLSDWNPSTRAAEQRLLRIDMPGGRGNPFGARLVEMRYFGESIGPVKLLGAVLDRANLSRATLIQADLRQASLRGAVLAEADLRQADLRGADLAGADLAGARLKDARVDCRTIWPAGSAPATRPDPDGSGVLCVERLVDP